MSTNRPFDPAALARARTELAAATGKNRLELILNQRDPEALVRALPGDDLYFTIREIGLGDAVDLVLLATPAQFRTFLDLACWTGDHLDPRKALPWLRAARVGALDSPRAAARWRAKLSAIDVEVLHLALRDTIVVHELERNEDPHIESDRFMRTPEGKYILEFRAEGTEYAAIRGIVDDLYAEDPFRATRLLSSIQWDLPSELEETALRWRTARLADLGYPSLEEALSWFARPGPRPVSSPGRPARPPGFWLERLGAGSLLARAARLLPPERREHLELELVTAANATLVADRVDPGDVEAVRSAVATARAFVEMGLEQGAGADDARAAEILAVTAVKSLFQRGFGRVLALKWRAERLLGSGGAGSREAPLLDAPLGEMLSALARRRPLYFPGIDRPREEWGSLAAAAFEPRGFLSSADVVRTADALQLAEQLVTIAQSLALADPRPETDRMAASTAQRLPPRLGTLYLTALANERLGRAFSPAPLDPAELVAAARALEDLRDPHLAAHGDDAGALLAGIASQLAEELAPLREGAYVRAEHLTALLVR